jgi:hypothetical protein
MSKIRTLKKIVNFELSNVIEECYVWQLVNQDQVEKSEALIDETIAHFDKLIARINQKDVSNKKAHFNKIKNDLFVSVKELTEKIS